MIKIYLFHSRKLLGIVQQCPEKMLRFDRISVHETTVL